MSYQNDPNINRRNNRIDRDETSYTGWIVGGLVALALIIGLFTMFGRDKTNDTTASNTSPNRPAATAPATTGSGAAGTAIPKNPNGTAPQRDTNQPAPAPRPAPAR
jgi:hypothetical protein